MALGISVDKSNPALNETYTITISPPQGGAFHHHVTLYESTDGGNTWTALQTWQTLGSSTPLNYSTSKSTAGTYTYQAIDYYIDNSIADQSGTIDVNVGGASPTTLTLSVDPNPVVHDPAGEGVATLTATLTADGTPLSGKTITFRVTQVGIRTPDLYTTTSETGTDGTASVQISPSLWWASYPDVLDVEVGAEFGGEYPNYGPSYSDWIEVKWYRADTTLTLTAPSSVSAGVQFQILVKLEPQTYSNEYQDKTIELWRDGSKVATAQTDTNGVAYFYQTLQPGTYSYQAKFNGEIGHLAPATSSTVEITATGAGSLTLSATPGSGQILYEWSKYEGANFDHYRLRVGTSSGGSDVANLTFSDVNKTSHILTGLVNGTTYYARIYAEDSSNSVLAQSEEIQATPQATTYTEVSGTATSQKISLTRAVSGQIISASTWNQDEQTIENFTGKIYIGSVDIPTNVKDVKVNLPSGLPASIKVIGILESPVPVAVSIEEVTSSYFKLHLSSAINYTTKFHYLIWGV
ncbi:fibronectin type III domain-containing protein [bacterium]|nr:fibronectin type III domain-containing protein [bacterium]